MGMNAVCPSCGHSQRSENHRGARLGDCPRCGTPMRAHTAGRAKGRYICPVNGGVVTLGLRYTVQLTEPKRLEFVPGWDDDRREPDPDRPGWLRPVTYHRTEPTAREEEQLDRAAGRVFGPGCVLSGGFAPPEPGDQYSGKAGVFLLPAPDVGPAAWFVNQPVTYKKCAACPRRVIASDKTRMDREWVSARDSYWAGSGWSMRRVEIKAGPHPAGTYACPDCQPPIDHSAGQPGRPPVAAVSVSGEQPSPSATNTRWASTCGQCQTAAPGPGGILCPPCREAIETQNRAVLARTPSTASEEDDEPGGDGQALREAAHRYLDHGLLPVPAWPARQNGECCCPRGADCPRQGKHPRSVHTGPGRHDYSWKPLACHTHQDVEERFADSGQYACANLMLAIPAGMMVIDIDHDDGGHQAITKLAAELGGLPATLGHQTPHGEHRIYRTPAGWTGRAWVGKDARNPLPAGIDLRMPGQILMAPPSRVPGRGGHLEYGPSAGDTVVALPPAYLTAWTPPTLQVNRPDRVMPVERDAADRAASYVHKKITGVLGDLASHQPGGRNAAIYTAALKIGSVLGAARTTPGAEHAVDGWTDEAAQDALMDAATHNGYIDAHSATMARSAIRSGLRNGLRSPRALPDFTSRPLAPNPGARNGRPRREQGTAGPASTRSASADREPDTGPALGPASSTRPPGTSRRDASVGQRVAAALWAAGYTASSPGHSADRREGYRMRALADGSLLIQPAANTGGIDNVKAANQATRTLDRYASALHDAGFEITRPGAGNIVVLPQPADVETGRHTPPAGTGQRNRMQANRAAVAANEAYRAMDFDQARQRTSEAAALDPSRAVLWQQHRSQIDTRELFLQAQAAHAEGDQDRAPKLMDDARQLDPRMQALWDRNLPGIHGGQRGHLARGGAAAGNESDPSHVAQEAARRRANSPTNGPQWPGESALYRNPGTSGQSGKRVSAARRASALAGAREPSAGADETAEPGQEDGASAARWRPRPIRHSPTTPLKGTHVPADPPRSESEKQDTHVGADRQAPMDPAPAAHKHAEFRHRPEPDSAEHPGRPGETARQPDTTDWRDAMIDTERQQWQSRIAQPSSPKPPTARVDADGPQIGA